ncbi:MAG: MFS transporter [Nocardioidaceae bacterium]|nr:MFS transporter [Nocardioidaceae bacterium]MCL2614771.1 MFS transporter [Nocardioidaceae bacterium]
MTASTPARRAGYVAACVTGLLGLAPYVVLSTAFVPLQQAVTGSLGTGRLGFTLAGGLSAGAYAVGAVVAAQVSLRRDRRTMFLVCEAAFVIATVAMALSPDVWVFAGTRVLQGLAAGGMLIAALPPLITGFGAARVPLSAAIVDIGIFGSSTLGPLIGTWVAGGDGWRLMLGAAAAIGAVGWVVALTSYESAEPADPDRKLDLVAIVLVVLVAAAIFTGTSLGTPVATSVLLAVGLLAFAALLLVERQRDEPLIPLRALSTQLPVTGILAAALGGAVFVAVVEVGESTGSVAWMWPMPLGALLGAIALWRLLVTRWMPVLVDIGMCALAAGALLLAVPARPLGALLLGFGAAATVTPGLFLTGLGLPSDRLGRAFALVQLLRAVATYAVAPVVVAATTQAPDHAFVAMAAVALAGLLLLLLIPMLSGARLRVPDVEAWLDGDKGMPSPATATHLRPSVEDDEAEPLMPQGWRERMRR